jgi:presenilin-like A22 family membrane protease
MLLAVFVAAQIVGLVTVLKYIDIPSTQDTGVTTFSGLPFNVERPQVEESTSYLYIIFAVIIGTLLLLLLIKWRKIGLWKLWFFLAVVATLTVALAAFIDGYTALVLAAILALWKIYRPNLYIHNLTEIMIYGGLAAIFIPIINIFSGIMLLILISIYDMYSVWRSRHMVRMAQFQAESKLFAGLYIPYQKPGEAKAFRRGEKKAAGEGIAKLAKTAVLGGGDIGFPLIFAGVVMKTLINGHVPIVSAFWQTMIVVLFSAIALFILLVKSEKDKFYPAMPFLSIGCFVGYAIIYFLL